VALGGPRFLLSTKPDALVVDPASVIALRRRVTLSASEATLSDALRAITRQTGVRFNLSREVVPVTMAVRVEIKELSIAAALTELLLNTRIDVAVISANELALVRRRAEQLPSVGTIAGTVTEAATRNPVPQAQVSVVGTSLGQTTGEDGRYSIVGVPAGQRTVSVRRLGYDPMSRDVDVRDGESATLDFALMGATTRLAEIVTTVTGGQRRVEMGSAIATVNSDSLMQSAPVMSFGDLLQGRAPGVLSMTTSNRVGQAGTIRLRGLNSFGVPNDPIVVIDGARVEATAGGSTAIAGPSPTSPTTGGLTGRLADLDPDEIESVKIVKGPSAATLYGTDAANGVLVITTKRGQPGRVRWTVFTEQGLVEQRLDEWDRLEPYYAFGHSTTTGAPQRCTLLQRAAGSCVLDSLASFNAFTDPATRPFKNGRREQYGLQVSGGTAGGTTYFLSGDYEQETGTWYMPPADQAFLLAQRGVSALPDWQRRPNAYRRVNLRANLTAPLGNRGSVTLTNGFVSNQARQPGFDTPGGQVGYRDINDGWRDNNRPAYQFAWHGEDVVRRSLGSLATSYTVWDWLTLRGTVGTDLSTNAYSQLLRRGEDLRFGGFVAPGLRTANELNVTRYSLDLGATATRTLSATVSSKTSLGVQYNRRAQRGLFISAANLPLGGQTIAGATNVNFFGPPSEATLNTAVAGGYVEEVLGLRDRLFLTGAVRFDGGSAFGQDFSVAVYPKASVSWVMTDGQVGPRLPGVSVLRLRAAYGASGVQPGPTAALQQIRVITGVSGTTVLPAAQVGAFGNPDLQPERTSELEAGFDLEMAAGRVRLEFTGYQRTSHDALISRPLSPEVGGGTGLSVGRRWENLGSVRNRGFELLLSADVLRGRVLSAGVTITGSLNENRLLELGEGVVVSSPTAEGSRQDVGYPLYGQWGRTVESFADANGNGIIEPSEITLTANHFIGPNFPTREVTAAPDLGLFGERLRLSGLVQYRGGFYVNGPVGFSCYDQWCRAVNDASTPLADQARAVAFTVLNPFGGIYTEPASYLLLRELSANLTLPLGWGRVVGAREARLVLAARNVALLWQQGTAPAPESASISADAITSGDTAGPSTYWLLRIHLNY
jgi:TonB-dependent SusC/RagA subfamily outer membrane receptor